MDERIIQFRVGVMFLGTLLCIAILLVMFGKLPSLMGQRYTIYIEFDNADGVTKDTPVRKSGILIGRVSNIQLTEDGAKVLVTAEIYSDKKIYKNEGCYINRPQLGMGDTSLIFKTKYMNEKPSGELVAGRTPKDPIKGSTLDDPTGLMSTMKTTMETVNSTGEALKNAANKMEAAAGKVQDILGDEQVSIHNTLDNAAESLKAIRAILGDQETQAKLAEAMRKLPATLDNMNETFDSANRGFGKLAQPSGQDGKTPIERIVSTIEMIEKTLKTFREGKPGEVPPAQQIADAVANINDITGLLKTVVGRIDNGDGTIGALMNDRELYDRLNRTVRNVNELTEKMKPILDDARVFSDKIARHPGAPIRDAIKPGPGIK
jgi:phospholipid/cholesterol/gamma-HCH transport system substrate-binding protein